MAFSEASWAGTGGGGMYVPMGETGPPDDAEARDEPPREGVRSGMMGRSFVVGPSEGGVSGEYDICAAAE